MPPKEKVIKKVITKNTSLLYNQVPFLDRPLQSILRFMQENREINRQTSAPSSHIEQTSAPSSHIEQTSAPSSHIEQTSALSSHIEQTSAPSEQDTEKEMFYSINNKHPYDLLSQKQMEVFGFTFSKQSNINALHKISPIYISKSNVLSTKNYQYVEEPKAYSAPIGPMTFLYSTVPQAPNPTFVNFLQACSK